MIRRDRRRTWMARRFGELRDRATGGASGLDSALARELRIVPGLNRSLLWLLAPESAWIARRRQMPFCTSLLAIART